MLDEIKINAHCKNHCHCVCPGNKPLGTCLYYNPDYPYGFTVRSYRKNCRYVCHLFRKEVMIFFLEGELKISIDGEKYILGAGHIITIPLFSVITCEVLADIKALFIEYPPTNFHLCLSRFFSLRDIVDSEQSVVHSNPLLFTPEVEKFVSLLLYYLERIPYCRLFHTNKLYELGTLLLYSYSNEELSRLFHPLLKKDLDFMYRVNAHLDTFTTVEEMAKEFNMSLSAFSKRFKKVFMESPYKWFLIQKANLISQYIASNRCSVTDIVYKFNFSSPSHFHKFCLVQYGCTPSELMNMLY